jgi:hypothetical protein
VEKCMGQRAELERNSSYMEAQADRAETLEAALLQKFLNLLNAKKSKIRSLEAEVSRLKEQLALGGGSSETPEAGDHDTDESGQEQDDEEEEEIESVPAAASSSSSSRRTRQAAQVPASPSLSSPVKTRATSSRRIKRMATSASSQSQSLSLSLSQSLSSSQAMSQPGKKIRKRRKTKPKQVRSLASVRQAAAQAVTAAPDDIMSQLIAESNQEDEDSHMSQSQTTRKRKKPTPSPTIADDSDDDMMGDLE